MDHPTNLPRGFGLSVLAFALFASHDAIIKSLGSQYSVFQVIFFAMLFSFVPLTLAMMADRNIDNFRPHHPWLLLFRTLCNLTAMSCAFYSFTVLPMAETYALLFATPILVTILSVPLLGEVVRLQRWVAVFIGLIGVLVVIRPGASELTFGHATALMAAGASSLSNIITRKVSSDERSAVLILIPMIASVLVMAAILPTVYVPVELPHLGAMAGIGLLGAFAQFAIIGAYKIAPAVFVAPIQYSQIIWATIFGFLFFDETPDKWVAIGATIIISSGVFIVWRESRSNVSQQSPVLRTANLRVDAGPSPKPKGMPAE